MRNCTPDIKDAVHLAFVEAGDLKLKSVKGSMYYRLFVYGGNVVRSP